MDIAVFYPGLQTANTSHARPMHGKSASPMRPSCSIKNKLMNANEILTREDLKAFKTELLQEIKTLLQAQSQGQNKKWLKSTKSRSSKIVDQSEKFDDGYLSVDLDGKQR